MPITRCADSGAAPSARLELFSSLDALPPDGAALFGDPSQTVFSSAAWYRTVIAHALPPGAEPCFALFRMAGRAGALFPLLQLEGGRRLHSLTTPYSCLYQPLLAADAAAGLLHAAGMALGAFCRRWPVVRLDALDADWPCLDPLLAGLRAAGLRAHRFDHFGNWHEPVPAAWTEYLAGRPGTLRETIRRRMRRCAGATRFELLREPGAVLEAGIEAFETVYRRSWKGPEPFPRFNAALMRNAASLGLLRLGLLHAPERPAAAQFWIVADGCATVLKLAHDETFRSLSPGTVLTALMIRELLDRDAVRELDFGRGDDPYKRLWVARRRQRIGVLLLNPRRPAGLAALGRAWLGRALRRRRT